MNCCSTCPWLGISGDASNIGPTPCMPPRRRWKRPPPTKCLRPWIPVTKNCGIPPYYNRAFDQPPLLKKYEIRYFCPDGCGNCGCRSKLPHPPPRCAEPLVPSKFWTMA